MNFVAKCLEIDGEKIYFLFIAFTLDPPGLIDSYITSNAMSIIASS